MVTQQFEEPAVISARYSGYISDIPSTLSPYMSRTSLVPDPKNEGSILPGSSSYQYHQYGIKSSHGASSESAVTPHRQLRRTHFLTGELNRKLSKPPWTTHHCLSFSRIFPWKPPFSSEVAAAISSISLYHCFRSWEASQLGIVKASKLSRFTQDSETIVSHSSLLRLGIAQIWKLSHKEAFQHRNFLQCYSQTAKSFKLYLRNCLDSLLSCHCL